MNLQTPEQIFKNGISVSMLRLWTRCPRRWYNHYIRGCKEPAGPSLIIGTAMDDFWNSWYDPAKPCRDLGVLKEKAKTIFRPEHEIDKPRYCLTQAQMCAVIDLWPQKFPPDTEPFKVVHTQKDIVEKIEGLCMPLHGILDGLVRKNNGELWVMENKTGGVYRDGQYDLDMQNVIYLKLAQALMNEKVEGVIYQNVSWHKQITDKSIRRSEITLTQDQINYRWDQFCKIANRMVDHVIKNWEYPEAFPMVIDPLICQISSCGFKDVCMFNDNYNLWDKG